MRVPFPSDVEDINRTDFDILRCLHMDGPAWKMEITRRLNHRRENEPLLVDFKPSITKQAVSNRVQRLHELEYVETTILTVADLDSVMVEPDQAFLTGYDISRKGENTLRDALLHILGDAAQQLITADVDVAECAALDRYSACYFDLVGQPVKEDDTFSQFITEHLLDR